MTSADALRVAFMPLGADWLGGQTLVTNCIRALQFAAAGRTHVRILGNRGDASHEYANAAGADGVVVYTAPARWSPRRFGNALMVRLQNQNESLGATLAAAGVQVLVGEALSWRLGRVATVGWLQDYQHVHMPDLFTHAELERRERKFRKTMQIADCLLTLAPACGDARAFAPEYAHKVRPVRPYSFIDQAIYDRDCARVVSRFGIPERFFYVPNQFWTHKNHLGLLQALHMLRLRNVCPHVVLTGATYDYRDPQHFARLQAQVTEWGLDDQVHYLGVVERQDVLDLIRQSICVVNPSLFEGWGYAVDEAASVGKRILASDIAAHRDQAPPACQRFDPLNPEDMANKLEDVWRTAAPGPDLALEGKARRNMPQRLGALADALRQVLQDAVEVHAG